jgi:hypothetical protein
LYRVFKRFVAAIEARFENVAENFVEEIVGAIE